MLGLNNRWCPKSIFEDAFLLFLKLKIVVCFNVLAITMQWWHLSSQIDLLVNNAGRSQRGLILDTEFAVDRHVIDLDLLGPISLTKAVLPHMVRQGCGHVMCTSSVAGVIPAPGSGTYAGAKHGLQVHAGFIDLYSFPRTRN